MAKKELIAILNFGGGQNQHIARRVRENDVYCEVYPYNMDYDALMEKKPVGIIFTGGSGSVYEANAPVCDARILKSGVPVLGVGYGAQVIAHVLGGVAIGKAGDEIIGQAVEFSPESPLFCGVENKSECALHTGVRIKSMPKDFKLSAWAEGCDIAAMENAKQRIYALLFHPELHETKQGNRIIQNFLINVCGCAKDWVADVYVQEKIQALKDRIGDKKALCALSGGVDSSVCAVLVNKAIGSQLTCIFVDHGLMRKNEGDNVMRIYKEEFNLNVIRVDAEQRFLTALKGVEDPEQKRKIIGTEFIRVFEENAKKLGAVDFLIQGTIYPDVMESGLEDNAVVKAHHNVGGLPGVIDFKEIIEPFRDLFKTEVRKVGTALNIPDSIVSRQPFPGPGLAVRVVGEVTKEKLDILRDADAIFREEMVASGASRAADMYFAIFTGIQTVGVRKGARSYTYTIALRSVSTDDFMHAKWVKIPYDVLERVSNRITGELPSVNRVVYDITSKPPSTIEWE